MRRQGKSTRLALVWIVLVQACTCGAEAETRQLPEPLERVTVGITLDEFAKLGRPAFTASIDSRTPGRIDVSVANQVVVEELKQNTFFYAALYTIRDKRLNTVILTGRHQPSTFDVQKEKFLGYLFARYGVPESLKVVQLRAGLNASPGFAMFWLKGDTVISAAFPIARPLGKSIYVLDVRATLKTPSYTTDLYESAGMNLKDSTALLDSARKDLAAASASAGKAFRQPNIIVDSPPATALRPRELEPGPVLSRKDLSEWNEEGLLFVAHSATTTATEHFNQEEPNSVQVLPPQPRPLAAGSTITLSVGEPSASTSFVTDPTLIGAPSYSAQGRLAWQNAKGTFVLDIKSGLGIKIHDASRVMRWTPKWSPDGFQLAASGTHSTSGRNAKKLRSYDEDIFITKVPMDLGQASIQTSWCIARLDGEDVLPVWVAGGKEVVFAHQDPQDRGSDKKSWALYRVRVNTAYDAEGYVSPVKIVGDLPRPDKLSVFPSGGEVLVSYANRGKSLEFQPERINIESKVRSKLNLSRLRDPDLRDGFPLIPHGLQVSPDGKQVAFHALRWSGIVGEPVVSCIYTCNLDGSRVRRMTPIQSGSSQVHKYPQPGVTSLNIVQVLEGFGGGVSNANQITSYRDQILDSLKSKSRLNSETSRP